MAAPNSRQSEDRNVSVEAKFLERIVPQQHLICLATERSNPVNGQAAQKFTNHFIDPKNDKADLQQIIADFDEHRDTNIYFAVAGYKGSRRTKSNVAALKVLLLDIDLWSEKLAKQGKDPKHFYHTKREATVDLFSFAQAVGLPKPWLVDSGNGLHAYFEFEEPLPPDEWLALADQFTRVVKKLKPKLAADPKRMRDAASVMRVPGTANAKGKDPVPTKVVMEGVPMAAKEIRTALSKHANASEPKALTGDVLGLGAAPAYAQTDEANQFGGTPLVNLPLRPILAGCKQVRRIATLRGNVPEPEWVLLLRVLNTVRKGPKAALSLSNGHPGFSARETIRKLEHVRTSFEAPSAGCTEFETHNAKLCKNCEFADKVWTPSQIPLIEIKAKEEEQAVQKVREEVEVLPPAVDVRLPMPAMYRKVKTDSGAEMTMLPVPNRNDPANERGLIKAHIDVRRGTVVLTDYEDNYGKPRTRRSDLRVHLHITSQGQWFPLIIPAVDLSADRLETATKAFRDAGVTIQADRPEEMRAVRKYLRTIVEVTALGEPLPHRKNKGWSTIHPAGKKPLTLGARRWLPDGTLEEGCTQSQHTGVEGETFIEAFCSGQPKGKLSEWQRAMEVYSGPHMELTQMLLLSGIANMLLPIVSSQKGGLLLALSGRSGVGKTTLLRFMGSFIGDPHRCMVPGSSTPNALVNMLKQSQFFMLPVDDTLKLDAEQLTLLLSAVSSGMEKLRLTGTVSQGTSYTANWADPFYSSLLITSNYSMDAIIGTGGADSQQLQSEAARSRLLEVPAAAILQKGGDADKWYDAETRLESNYGHAVVAMAKYLATHQKQIGQMAHKMRVKIERDLVANTPLDQHALARFWARYITCVGLTGIILCERLNILPWDPQAIIKAATNHVKGVHEETTANRMMVTERLWNMATDNQGGRYNINYSYLIADDKNNRWPNWNEESPSASQRRRRYVDWDSEAAGNLLLSNLNIGAPPNVSTVLGQPHCWRVILTTVKRKGKVIRIERDIEIGLEKLVWMLKAHPEMGITGWEELYYDLTLSSCPVRGVRPESPTKWGRGQEQYIGYVDATRKNRGVGQRAVLIALPPLSPKVLEPDDKDDADD